MWIHTENNSVINTDNIVEFIIRREDAENTFVVRAIDVLNKEHTIIISGKNGVNSFLNLLETVRSSDLVKDN